MGAPHYDPEDETTVFDGIRLDDVTMARLLEVCESACVPPAVIISAIVRDVLEDDAQAHDDSPVVVRRDANKDLH